MHHATRFQLVALAAALCVVSGSGCGSDGSTRSTPCAAVLRPPCPPTCDDAVLSRCGEPCEREGETCGNEIGDSRTCQDGAYQCVVHPPLAPDGCNRLCS